MRTIVHAGVREKEKANVGECRTKCFIESANVSHVGGNINHIQINKLICAKWHGATSSTIHLLVLCACVSVRQFLVY